MTKARSAPLALSFVAVAFLPRSVLCADTILWDERSEHAVSMGVLVPEAEFTEQVVIETCQRALRSSRVRFLSLAIVTDTRQRFDLALAAHVPFEIWAKNCHRAATSPLRAAVMTKVGGDAAVRIRDGLLTRNLVLAGNDPFQIQAAGADCSILHISFARSTIFPFVVYARCAGTDLIKHAEDLYTQLQRRLSEPAIQLTVRRDPWFSQSGLLGICWWALGSPPNEQAVGSAAQVICARYRPGEPPCTGSR